MNKQPPLHWAVEITECDNLVFGKISHCRHIGEKEGEGTDDLVAQLGDDGVQHLLMNAILAITPDTMITLTTPGPGAQEWFKYPKRNRFRRFIDFFVEFYLGLLNIFIFIFRIKNPSVRKHTRNIREFLERELSKVYTTELKKDHIPLLYEDSLGRYCIKLKKNQLPKYLDALGEYGGVPEHYDTVVVSRHQEQLLQEDDIKFLADTLIFKGHPHDKGKNSKIESIMKDYEMIGILVEGYYYFIAHSSAKKYIVGQLEKVASKYYLTTDLNEKIL